jgi:hypothetical protein
MQATLDWVKRLIIKLGDNNTMWFEERRIYLVYRAFRFTLATL